jgi:tRNA threonylcarbamoyladenosine biosynthesis protein TsaE
MFLTVKKYSTESPEETMEVGYHLGQFLGPGDVVCLYGELGTGKTVLVKGIARAFGIRERDIASASFTIVTEYATSPPFAHVDLYRIERTEELAEIGIWEQVGAEGITVIEWAEKAEGLLPDDRIAVFIRAVDETVRDITIEGLHEKDRDYIENRSS